MPVTTDFAGTETLAETKSRLATLLTAYGYDSSGYSTWGDARTDLNSALTAIEETTISDGELASSFRSKLNALNALSDYPVLTFFPDLIFDFENEVYRTDNASDTFSSAITHSATTNATMVDSDGVLKWRPHNLALNSASPATQSITVISGADYTVECTGVSIALSGAGSGTVTEGNPVEITASTTTLTLTVTGSTGTMWVYRSDLGGMVDNPDTGNSYVPTTGAARYLPRRGHHVWNGSAWVNEGLLHESEARTNSLTYSEDLSNAAWSKSPGVTIGTPVTRNGISLDLIENDGTDNFRNVTQSAGSVADGAYLTFSCFIEAGTSTETAIRVDDVVSGASSNRVSIPITWTSGVPSLEADVTLGLTFVDASLQDWEDGVYRVHLTVLNGTGGALTLYPKYYVQWNDTAAAVNTYAGGFQAELGSTPSSYIPTSGSTVTRAAETLTIPAAKLPWPTPNVIGPELVTGAPDLIGSDWTDNGDGSYTSDGTQTVGENEVRWNDASIVAGNVFKVSGTVSGRTTGNLGVRLGAGGYKTFSDNDDFEFILADAGVANVQFAEQNGFDGTISNVSVREIDPLSVSIQMDGLETFADEGSATQETLFDWRVDSNNRITLALDTDSTKVGTLTLTMVNGSGTDETISTTAELTPGVNDPFNVAIVCTSNEIGIALDGTAETRVSHSIGLPDLSAEDATLGGNGTRAQLRAWAVDLTNAGQESATS